MIGLILKGLDFSKFQIKPEMQLLDVYGGRTMNFYSSNVSNANHVNSFNH